VVCDERAGPGEVAEFRHQLPVLMNEWFAHYKQRKVSTDMAVPDERSRLFRLYKDTLQSSGLRYTIFGHIGDNHVHVNILPRDETKAHARASCTFSF
jgi:D-lactate dehydrogenase (cytochrome)